MLQKENQWFVLHFGTNHIVHKNLTFYFLSRSIFIIVLGQKRGSKPVRFSSSPHHTSEGREDIFFLCSQNRARKKPGNRMVSGFFGAISFLVAQCGCGGRTRTCGLRVMRASGQDLSVPKCPIQALMGHFWSKNRPTRVTFSYLGHRRRTWACTFSARLLEKMLEKISPMSQQKRGEYMQHILIQQSLFSKRLSTSFR